MFIAHKQWSPCIQRNGISRQCKHYIEVGTDRPRELLVYCLTAHSLAFFSQLRGTIVLMLPFTPYFMRSTASIRSSNSTTCTIGEEHVSAAACSKHGMSADDSGFYAACSAELEAAAKQPREVQAMLGEIHSTAYQKEE